MRVKKFLARNMAEAMDRIKAELGSDALILQTVPRRMGGLFGLIGGSRVIEVTAAVDAEARPARAVASAAPAAVALPDLGAVRQDVGEVRRLVSQLARRIELPEGPRRLAPGLRGLAAALVRRGVDPALASRLALRVEKRRQKAGAPRSDLSRLAAEVMERDVGEARPIEAAGRRRVIALIGPTGVGKTTTLAKLAAHLTLGRRLDVALITADTYRIAAVQQLRSYAEIIGVPLEVLASPEEVPAALRKHAGRQIVLVDTAGRSWRNEAQMAELQAYLAALKPDETHLVLSLTAALPDLLATARAYQDAGYSRFLFTKLDEATSPGVIYSLVRRVRRPLSYLTTGQNVPEDMEVAHPSAVRRLVLGD